MTFKKRKLRGHIWGGREKGGGYGWWKGMGDEVGCCRWEGEVRWEDAVDSGRGNGLWDWEVTVEAEVVLCEWRISDYWNNFH